MAEWKTMSMHILETVLETPPLYSIVVAFRGPDFDAETLKWLFTCRIRGIISICPCSSYRRHSSIDFGAIIRAYEEAYHAMRSGADTMHYLWHIKEALEALRQLLEEERGRDDSTVAEISELLGIADAFTDLLDNNIAPDDAMPVLKRVYMNSRVIKVENSVD